MPPRPRRRVAIRRASLDDAPDLARFEPRVFERPYVGHRFSRGDFVQYLAAPHAVGLVAHAGEAIAGYALGIWSERGRRRTARIDSIAVASRHRRRGLGGRLLKRLLSRLTAAGCDDAVLETAIGNRGAIALFEQHGFVVERRLPAYYTPRTSALRMRRALAPKLQL